MSTLHLDIFQPNQARSTVNVGACKRLRLLLVTFLKWFSKDKSNSPGAWTIQGGAYKVDGSKNYFLHMDLIYIRAFTYHIPKWSIMHKAHKKQTFRFPQNGYKYRSGDIHACTDICSILVFLFLLDC